MAAREHSTTSFYADMLRACRHRRRKLKIADSTGSELTGGALLARALVLRRLLRRLVLAPDERMIGVLLPPTTAGAATNLALALDRRVAVNLNYTLTADILNGCLAKAGVRHILTSRQFLEKVPLQLNAEMVCLEDLRDRPTTRDKLIGAAQAYVLPVPALIRALGLERAQPSDLVAVIFTSGSTGAAKGAMVSAGNIATLIDSASRAIRTVPSDVLVGILPFFHTFGYVVTLWAGLCFDIAVAYHPNPLDARGVGQLTRQRHGTILLATPMFLRSYEGRCEPADFASVEVVIAGGERLTPAIAEAFEQRFGQRPVEGYGCTETTSLIAANVPPARAFVGPELAWREGTVGRPLPGVQVRVTDLETGASVPVGQPGMLWVTGPNVMRGYLNDPQATAAVMADGWYKTGDVVTLDEEGFIRIIGRESRFAKIGGEMVPHGLVEDALTALVGGNQEDEPSLVVVSIPDPIKGERLIVVHTGLPQSPAELRRGLAAAGLPPLFIPSEDSFVQIDHIPLAGSGKLDLPRITAFARAAASRRPRVPTGDPA